MGIETTTLFREDPRIASHQSMITAPIEALSIVNARNLLGAVTLAQATDWVNATIHPNRTITGLLNQYAMAEATLHNNPAETTTASGIMVMRKQTRIDTLFRAPQTVRVRVEARVSANTADMQFRRNGATVSGNILITSTVYTFHTFDIPNCSPNDTIEIWGVVYATNTLFVRNLEIRGTNEPIPNIQTAVHLNTVGVLTPITLTSLL